MSNGRYVFVSTHISDANHAACKRALQQYGYTILGEQSFQEATFSEDGILVAASPAEARKAGGIAAADLGCRQHTPLRETIFDALRPSPSDLPCAYSPAWFERS